MLCLLKIVPAKLKIFEANRVSDIITTLPNVRWKYVPTLQNTVDCATRGMSAQELSEFSAWWSGPSWLQTPADWPDQLDLESITPTVLSLVAEPIREGERAGSVILEKFDSFNKSVRVLATILRWTPSLRRFRSEPLSAKELTSARIKLLRLNQLLHFAKEVNDLKKKGQIARKSTIAFLRPILDSDGLLRVGSRIEECPYLTDPEKYPVILSIISNLSEALAWDYHQLFLHGGPQLVLSVIAKKYFFICGKRVVRSIIPKCSK